MGYRMEPFAEVGLDDGGALLGALIREHEGRTLAVLRRLWAYYRNPMASGVEGGRDGARRYRLGQEEGLPARLSHRGGGGRAGGVNLDDRATVRNEVVIENDIAWRVHTMVDFMFGRPITLLSMARDEGLRRTIERVLDAVWEASGGASLLHDIGLLGHVYGHIDVLVRRLAGAPGGAASGDDATSAAGAVRIEAVEPTRGIALMSAGDFRRLDAYIVRYEREENEVEAGAGVVRFLGRLVRPGSARNAGPGARRRVVIVTEILSGGHRQVYEEDAAQSGRGAWLGAGGGDRAGAPRLLEDEPNLVSPGEVPVVHIQNISQPLAYSGLSEVEPLIPLQDELNTRLSDRASRVTMQSFKMFLAKGMEGFDRLPVGPGQVFATENMEATVSSFGGDSGSGGAGGESEHIEQVREAMDKASAVPPLASGVVRAKIGNLSSENALRVTLMGLLSKTARKRVTYGRGIAEVCRLVLTALDECAVLRTAPEERGVRVEWPDPLPRDEHEALSAAKLKVELGVARERVLSELGYAPGEPGVV